MRRVFWVTLTVVIAALAVGWFYRDIIGFMLMQAKLTPKESFSDDKAPAAPDYANVSAWAALPSAADGADLVIPNATEDKQATAQADVFYIHPTNLITNAGWNAPLDDPGAKDLLEKHYLEAQASVFNECCRVYAPRYRAAAFAAFLDKKGSGKKAIELAYGDVAAAFDYYLAHYNQGRPIILAAHSQGSLHLLRLLAERIKGKDSAPRIVAAYAIGWPVDARTVALATGLPVCDTPEKTGCLISWNTVGPNAKSYYDPAHNVCVNPLTWRADGAHAASDLDSGTLVGRTIQPKAVDGQCTGGMLVVKEFNAPALLDALKRAPINLGRDVYHAYDYNLFYMNLRSNAAERVLSWLHAQPNAVTDGPAPSSPNQKR